MKAQKWNVMKDQLGTQLFALSDSRRSIHSELNVYV